ncbi:MAG TPA: nucleotidyltransferase domain-containing protein [Firmicutes bacterium]|nr:nucleotidyltransferase domain-containing protein [Bacillota bacterium]
MPDGGVMRGRGGINPQVMRLINRLCNGRGHDIVRTLRCRGVVAAYVFGSRVDDASDKHGDLDIGVLFPGSKLDGLDFEFASLLTEDLAPITFPAVPDVILLQKTRVPVAFEAMSRGQILFSDDEGLRAEFEDRVISDYLDLNPMVETYWRGLPERLREKIGRISY